MLLTSHDSNGIKNCTITFSSTRHLKWGATWLSGHVMPLALASVPNHANSIINTAFLRIMTIIMKCIMTFLVMWCHWYKYQYHVISMASSMAPLHFFRQDNQNDMQHCQWCWHHMIPMESKMVPLHSLAQDISNNVQHVFLVMWCHWQWHQCHIMLTALPNGSMHSLDYQQLKWDASWLFAHVIPIASSMAPLHFFSQDKQNEMATLVMVLTSHDASGIKMASLHSLPREYWNVVQHDCLVILYHWHWPQCHIMPTTSSMVPLYSLDYQQLKWGVSWHSFLMWCHWHQHQHYVIPIASSMAPLPFFSQDNQMRCNMMFWSFDAIGTGISVKSYQQHFQWYHCIPWNKAIEIRCNMTFCHIMPLTSTLTLYEATGMGVMWSHLLVSPKYDMDNTPNGTTEFLRSRWSNWDRPLHFGHVTALPAVLASCGANSVVNGTTALGQN